MTKIKFSSDVTGSPLSVLDYLNIMALQATTISQSTTEVVREFGALTFTIGLSDDGVTIDSLTIDDGGSTVMTMTDIGVDNLLYQLAIVSELFASDPAAIENLFMPLGWNYKGNSHDDILLSGTTNADGVLINLSGDDVVRLRKGNDKFDLGDGDDKGYGGKGSDEIWGGAGDDFLKGGKGADTLHAGTGDDELFGGKGADTLIGDSGDNIFIGGKGDDMMVAGDGIDTFIFNAGHGDDVLSNFDAGVDTMQFVDLTAITYTEVGDDVLVNYGSGSVLVLDTDLADFNVII